MKQILQFTVNEEPREIAVEPLVDAVSTCCAINWS